MNLARAAVAFTFAAACSVCSETEVNSSVSGHGDRATVIVRDCGATTDFATVVQVGSFRKTDVVAVRGKVPLALTWNDATVLAVQIPKAVSGRDIFPGPSKVGAVRIMLERN